MMNEVNELGQRIGFPVADFTSPRRPTPRIIQGNYCRLEPMNPAQHARELFEANNLAPDSRYWTYLPYGPFDTLDEYRAWLEKTCTGADPLFHTIIDLQDGKAAGIASLMRIDPGSGSIEVGHINYSPRLQKTTAATEAMYLLMARAFDELGYRRYEWKCNDLNEGSKNAARRLGFTYEGTFRQMTVSKGRNRDTAWFSILDSEWPEQRRKFEKWLSADNFNEYGKPLKGLTEM